MRFIYLTSAWAARYSRQAIFLIILIEFANVLIGITVGSALLQTLAPWKLMMLILGVIIMRICLKQYAHIRLLDLYAQVRFRFQKQIFTLLFFLNLFAYTIAGGIIGHIVDYPEASSNLYGSFTTTSTLSESSSSSKKISFRAKMRQNYLRRVQKDTPNRGLMRVGYIALFFVGAGLALIGAAIACNLACSGIGFGAVLVLLLSTGVLAGGFYFLGRGVDRNMKPYQEMDKKERKREGRRYLRTLAGTGAALLVLMLSSIAL
jgi:hypothetical protein